MTYFTVCGGYIIYVYILTPTLSRLHRITLEKGYFYSISRKYWQVSLRSPIILFPNRLISYVIEYPFENILNLTTDFIKCDIFGK